MKIRSLEQASGGHWIKQNKQVGLKYGSKIPTNKNQMTKAEKERKAILAERACCICERIHGPHEGGNVELHHLRSGGWGKGDYTTLIPLCYTHHRGAEGIHTLGTKAWERKFNVSQTELLEAQK